MKKNYSSPETEVVLVRKEYIFTGSPSFADGEADTGDVKSWLHFDNQSEDESDDFE